ncbi:uncharacterized protein LOC119988593 isoform X1 [Tripterygium wilfordii]|uniref:uncharacterized protein LOC119988593 isoform X1 n=1 Tax=Tripterygium wilfordii TaxID=458696 RepID=UPI0018F82EBF|nr:uncharacterized protein LOC119988593 isoform X1 [Tripterygium wilfordii]
MEDSKEESVLVGSVSESIVVAGGESETLDEGQDQIEGSSTEQVMEEGEVCDEGDVRDSGGDVSDLGTETEAGDSSILSDPSEGQNQGAEVTREDSVERDKKTTDEKGVVNDDKGLLRAESIDDEAQEDRVGTRVDGSAEVVSSTEIEGQNLQTVEVITTEGDANENVKSQDERIGTLVDGSVEAVSSTKIESQNLQTVEVVATEGDANENVNSQDERVETRVDGSTEAVSSSEIESQHLQAVEVVAREGDANENVNDWVEGWDLQDHGINDGEGAHTTEEVMNVKSEEKSSGILVEEGVDRMKIVDDEVDAVQDIKTPEAGNSVHGIHDSVTETKVTSSLTMEKDFSLQNQDTEEEAAASLKQEEAKGGNSFDGTVNDSYTEHVSVTKRVCGEPEREAVDSKGQGSLDEQKIATSEGEFAVVSNEELTCSKVEDSIPLSQHVQVTSGLEIAAVDDKALSNSNKECLDQSTAYEVAHVDSKLESWNDFDKQVIQAKQVGLHDKLETEFEQRESKAETVNGDSGINSHVLVDATTSCQSSSVVVGDKISVNSSPNVEISDYVDMDGMLSCSGKKQDLTAETVSGETVADVQAIDGGAETASQPMETEERVADTVPCVIQAGAVEGTKVLGSGARDQPLKSGETVDESASHDHLEVNSNVGKEMKVGEQAVDAEESNVCGGQGVEVEEQNPGQANKMEEKIIKQAVVNYGSSVKMPRATYQLPREEDDMFSVSDLVWGKVKSHPWWPGQILDPSDASEKAMKYQKKDCFLVGYFGDRTFAWNEESLLKPFQTHFSQVEKQSNSEAFQNAVSCALEEVSRRVELGLSCSCTPKDAYEEIKYQIVENAGIPEELSKRGGVDKSTTATSFESAKLVEYLKALAQSPSGGADRLELVIAKAQLLSFYRLKGFHQLPEFQDCGGLPENNVDTLYGENVPMDMVAEHMHNEQISAGQEILAIQKSSYHKRKHNLKDSDYLVKKERSLSELMDEEWDSPEDDFEPDGKLANKRRAVDSFADDSANQEGRKTISFAKVSSTTPSIPKPSFKIGDCIRRVAPSILKCDGEKFQKLEGSSDRLSGNGSDASLHNVEDAEKIGMILPVEYSSLDELLSQLYLAARDPSGEYEFLNVIASFFSDFRNSVVLEQFLALEKGDVKGRMSHPLGGSPGTFEFEDMSDTYWTDRIIQSGSEEQPSRKSRKREIDPIQGSRRSYSKRRYSDSNDVAARKPIGYVDENSPAELVMNFSEVNTVPSELNLNKMFKHFGPLKESETEVDKEASRARVVFKRCSDAEAAFSSAGKFGIFGPVAVNYQLNYTVSAPFRTPLVATTQGDEDTTLCLEY